MQKPFIQLSAHGVIASHWKKNFCTKAMSCHEHWVLSQKQHVHEACMACMYEKQWVLRQKHWVLKWNLSRWHAKSTGCYKLVLSKQCAWRRLRDIIGQETANFFPPAKTLQHLAMVTVWCGHSYWYCMVLVHGMVTNSIGGGALGHGALGLVLGHCLLAHGGLQVEAIPHKNVGQYPWRIESMVCHAGCRWLLHWFCCTISMMGTHWHCNAVPINAGGWKAQGAGLWKAHSENMRFVKLPLQHENVKALCATRSKQPFHACHKQKDNAEHCAPGKHWFSFINGI